MPQQQPKQPPRLILLTSIENLCLTLSVPGRPFLFHTGETYHIYNQGIDRRKVFTDEGDYERALLSLEFYQVRKPVTSLSSFLSKFTEEEREKELAAAKQREKLVEFFSFCLMPNHFHLVIRQETDGGLSKFISNFLNSYTRFFNLKHERVGNLFLNQFKAVRIASESQLLHTVRYTLLNPYTTGVVKTLKELERYPYSALPDYLGRVKRSICDKTLILSHFKDRESFRRFILDRADYQRSLEEIKHLTLEH